MRTALHIFANGWNEKRIEWFSNVIVMRLSVRPDRTTNERCIGMKGADGVMKLVPGFAVLSGLGLVLLAAAPEDKSPKPRGRAHLLAVLSCAEASGEDFWHIQRSPRAGQMGAGYG